jgi:hypothetical protein
MSTITKEAFLRQKISNFIIFIKTKIGEDNNIYREFIEYEKNLEYFLRAVTQLTVLAPKGIVTNEMVEKYLKAKGIEKKLPEDDITLINRYIQMFLKLIK